MRAAVRHGILLSRMCVKLKYGFVQHTFLYDQDTYFIEGLVTDKVTGKILPNTTVTRFDKDGNVVAEQFVGEDGRYKLPTQPSQKYSVEGFQPKYIPQVEFFDTND